MTILKVTEKDKCRLGHFAGVLDIIFPEPSPRFRKLKPIRIALTQQVKVPGFEGTVEELLWQELEKSGQPGLDNYPSELIFYGTEEEMAILEEKVPPKAFIISLPKEWEKECEWNHSPYPEGTEVIEWWPARKVEYDSKQEPIEPTPTTIVSEQPKPKTPLEKKIADHVGTPPHLPLFFSDSETEQ